MLQELRGQLHRSRRFEVVVGTSVEAGDFGEAGRREHVLQLVTDDADGVLAEVQELTEPTQVR